MGGKVCSAARLLAGGLGFLSFCLSPRAGAIAPADVGGLVPSGLPEAPAPSLSEAGARRARALARYFEGLREARGGRPEQALKLHLEALELDRGNLFLSQRLAGHYARAGKLTEALALLEEALRRNEDDPRAYIALSEFCARHHNNSDAVKARGFEVARQAVDRFPSSPAVYGNLVALLLLDGEPTEAAHVLEAAAARPETSARYWLGLGELGAQVWGRRDASRSKAFDFMEKAVSLAGEDSGVLEAAADFMVQEGRIVRAVELYERFAALRPDDLRARQKLAHALSLSGRKEEAQRAWEKLLEVDPNHEDAHQALARLHTERGNASKALEHRAAAFSPAEAGNLGAVLPLVREMIGAGLHREALRLIERAEFARPESPEPPLHAAIAHRQLGELSKARDAFARAEAAAQADPSLQEQFLTDAFYFEWGLACSEAGDLETAAEKFRASVSRVPADQPQRAARSYNALGYLWLEHDVNIDEAGELISRALKFEPENAAYLDSLGWFHFKKGELEQALAVLRRAEAAAPQPDPENLDHIARVLHALGRRDEARATLQKGLALPGATEAMRRRLEDWK